MCLDLYHRAQDYLDRKRKVKPVDYDQIKRQNRDAAFQIKMENFNRMRGAVIRLNELLNELGPEDLTEEIAESVGILIQIEDDSGGDDDSDTLEPLAFANQNCGPSNDSSINRNAAASENSNGEKSTATDAVTPNMVTSILSSFGSESESSSMKQNDNQEGIPSNRIQNKNAFASDVVFTVRLPDSNGKNSSTEENNNREDVLSNGIQNKNVADSNVVYTVKKVIEDKSKT